MIDVLYCDFVFVGDRARNVELIEARPDLPRQTYQHGSRTKTSFQSSSLDRCSAQPANQHSVSSVSVSYTHLTLPTIYSV